MATRAIRVAIVIGTMILGQFVVALAARQPANSTAASQLTIDLPLAASGWITAVGAIAARDKVAVGLELAPEPRSLSADQPGTMLDLTGLSLFDAIKLMVQHDGRYVARSTPGVLNVRPVAAINAREDFLNRQIPRVDIERQPLNEVLYTVHRLLDPGYPLRARRPPLASSFQNNPTRGAQVQQALGKPISVHLVNVTVKDVLNAIAVADGEMWWHVTYKTTLGAYEESKVTFVGYDNWAIAARARPRR